MILSKTLNYVLLILNYVFDWNKNRFVHINHKQYIDFDYSVYGKKYKYRLKISDDPMIFRNIKICDELNNDITKNIIIYGGPFYNFNNLKPDDFGYETLFFYEDDVLIHRFSKNESIVI